jgi:hypothetical protein
MKMKNFTKSINLCFGSMDAITGAMLIFAPSIVLKILGIEVPEKTSFLFLSWLGVFILGVGLSYFFALKNPSDGRLVWKITALTRFMVAAFIGWKVMANDLEMRWLLVAVSDAMVATFQCYGLRKNWWKEHA